MDRRSSKFALEHLNVHFWSSNRYDDKAKTTLELLVNEANHRKPAAQEVGPAMKLIFVSGKQRSCVLLQFWSWDWGQSQHLYHFVAVHFCSSPRLYREYKGDYKAIAAKLCLDGHGQRFRNLWNWLWLYCIGCSKFKSPKQSRCEATVSSSTRKAWFLMLQLHRKAQRDWSLENLKPTHIECVQEFLKVFFQLPWIFNEHNLIKHIWVPPHHNASVGRFSVRTISICFRFQSFWSCSGFACNRKSETALGAWDVSFSISISLSISLSLSLSLTLSLYLYLVTLAHGVKGFWCIRIVV